jgi:hypothetical protein
VPLLSATVNRCFGLQPIRLKEALGYRLLPSVLSLPQLQSRPSHRRRGGVFQRFPKAFLILWKPFQARWILSGQPTRRPPILFLADRNSLADQACNDYSACAAFAANGLPGLSPIPCAKRAIRPSSAGVFLSICQTLCGPTCCAGPPGPCPAALGQRWHPHTAMQAGQLQRSSDAAMVDSERRRPSYAGEAAQGRPRPPCSGRPGGLIRTQAGGTPTRRQPGPPGSRSAQPSCLRSCSAVKSTCTEGPIVEVRYSERQ